MRVLRTLLVLTAIGVGLWLSVATSAPYYEINDQVDLGAIVVDPSTPHQLSGRVTLNDAAASWAPPCSVGYLMTVHNSSVSSGALHLWSLAEPFSGELPADLEPVQSAIVRGFPSGERGDPTISLLAPCPVSGALFHFALTMEGGAHVEGTAVLKALASGGSEPPEGAAIEVALEAP